MVTENHPRLFEGNLIGTGLKIGLLMSRFNEAITQKLFEGAKDCLLRHGVNEQDLSFVWVSGAFELPLFAKQLVISKKFDALICLGAIVRGDTPHFDFVASESAKGIAQVSIEYNLPVVYGIITADSFDQALDRAGGKSGNKGWQAALTAIESANLMSSLKGLK